ncbi:hypothetical protein GALL_03360 [mine drainage metagenome]|uniref:Outer membrane protein beta-barrel domain-containing protein n=1 Tax=mine drainage metagenome TaxID=410659 RepID=A0A1J5TEX6_9ZZZZ
MKNLKQIVCIPVATIIMSMGATQVLAETSMESGSTRVVEDTLVLKDPTVSASGKWVFGAALEGLYTNGPAKYNVGDQVESGTISGARPGLNLFAGYGDVTVNYAYRNGNADTTGLYHYATATNPFNYGQTFSSKINENEITVRWLLRDLSTTYFTPYLYAGYVDAKYDNTNTITTPGLVWANNNNSPTLLSTNEWKGSMLGIGGIIPLTKDYGFRLDGALTSTSATYTASNGGYATGTGLGSRFTGTMYYNIAQGWNIQAGGRYQYLNGGNAGSNYIAGVFAMIGYSYK